MQSIRLGRTNVRVPSISLGTWGHGGLAMAGGTSVGWSGHDDGDARESLVTAHSLGITHWDTADVYGRGQAEKLIGEVWDTVPRDSIFIATKFGYLQGPAGHFYDPAFMRSQLEASLRNLRTEAVDLYYLHHCNFGPDDRYFEGALAQLQRFRQEGKVRFIGLSDWKAARILALADRVKPDVIQPYRNVVDDDYESSGLGPWARAHDVGVAFFSPLKHGVLLGKYTEPVQFPEGDHRRGIPEFGDATALARLTRARDLVNDRFSSHPRPVLHALTGALLAGNPTSTVLMGMRTPDHVRAAAEVGEALSLADAAWVAGAYRGDFLGGSDEDIGRWIDVSVWKHDG
jgi:myo-inositol catabolism protein IolS